MPQKGDNYCPLASLDRLQFDSNRLAHHNLLCLPRGENILFLLQFSRNNLQQILSISLEKIRSFRKYNLAKSVSERCEEVQFQLRCVILKIVVFGSARKEKEECVLGNAGVE